jgi:hypothetical protein
MGFSVFSFDIYNIKTRYERGINFNKFSITELYYYKVGLGTMGIYVPYRNDGKRDWTVFLDEV